MRETLPSWMKRRVRYLVWFGVACTSYPFQVPPGEDIEAVKQEITVDLPSQSDIVFVVDNSGSMLEEVENMRNNIGGFISAMVSRKNSFRVAFVTTDNQESGDCNAPMAVGGFPINNAVDPVHHGRCGRFLAPRGKAGFIDSVNFASPEAMTAEVRTYLDPSISDTSGSAYEQPLRSAYSALDPALTASGGPNSGFYRDDAMLLIVIVSDESDCSFDDSKKSDIVGGTVIGSHCYSQTSSLVSPQDWAARIRQRRIRPANVRVGLISGSAPDTQGQLQFGACKIDNGQPTNQCDCFLNNPNEYCQYTRAGPRASNAAACNANDPVGTCCISLANDRLFAFANEFKNVKETICRPSYGEALLALATLADVQCFALAKTPYQNDPVNVQVSIRRSGAETSELLPFITTTGTDGWSYDGDITPPQVCLSGTAKRQKGDTLNIFVVDVKESSTLQPPTP